MKEDKEGASLGEETEIKSHPTKKRKWTTIEDLVMYESSIAKAIKKLQQVPTLTLPVARPMFFEGSSIKKENPLFASYNTASKDMMH